MLPRTSPGVLSLASSTKGRKEEPCSHPLWVLLASNPASGEASSKVELGYLRDCQLPTLGCLEEKGNSSGTMQTEALNNYQRGATYWKLKVLSLFSQQTLDPTADSST